MTWNKEKKDSGEKKIIDILLEERKKERKKERNEQMNK